MNQYSDDPFTEPHFHFGKMLVHIESLLASADKLREAYEAFKAAEKRRDEFIEKTKKAE